jgi:hypothetical protein
VTKRSVLSLAIKILGIFLVLRTIPKIPSLVCTTVFPIRRPFPRTPFFYETVPPWIEPIAVLVGGAVLIVAANSVASRMANSADEEDMSALDSRIAKEDACMLILFGIGVWAALHTIDSIVRPLLSIHLARRPYSPLSDSDIPRYFRAAFGMSIQFAVAMSMILRPRAMALWFVRFMK